MTIAGNEPDIICITEVIPKAQTVPINPALFQIPRYTMHLNFSPSQAELGASGLRGIAIYCAEHLNAGEFYPKTNFKEQLWMEVRLAGNTILLLGCIYRSPSTDASNTKLLNQLFWELEVKNPSHLLIVGDFNMGEIDWDSGFSSAPRTHHSHEFLEVIRDCYLHQHVLQPTRFRQGTVPSLLDLVFTNEENMVKNLQTRPGLGRSDHVLLEFQLQCYSVPEHSSVIKRALHKADIPKMTEMLCGASWNETKHMDTNAFYNFFMLKLRHAIDTCVPIKDASVQHRNIYMNRQALSMKNKKQ